MPTTFSYRRNTDGADHRRGLASKFYLIFNPEEQYVSRKTVPAGTGNLAFTGVGFQPDVIVIMACYETPLVASHQGRASLGCASASAQWCYGTNIREWVYGSNRTSWREDACCSIIDGFGNELLRASLVSMDADGFTLNVSVQGLGIAPDVVGNPTTLPFAFIAMKGVFEVGSAPTSSGLVTYSGIGFDPKAAWFACSGNTTTDIRTGWDHMTGFVSAEDARPISNWAGARASGNPNQSAFRWDDDGRCFGLHIAHKSLSPASSRCRAYMDAWLTDGFRLNWSADDGITYRFGYLLSDNGEAGQWQMSGIIPPDTGLPNNYSDLAEIETRIEALAMLSTCVGYSFPLSSQPVPPIETYPDVYDFPGLAHFSFGAKQPWSMSGTEEEAAGWSQSSGGPSGGGFPVTQEFLTSGVQMKAFPKGYTGDVPFTLAGMAVSIEESMPFSNRTQFYRWIKN